MNFSVCKYRGPAHGKAVSRIERIARREDREMVLSIGRPRMRRRLFVCLLGDTVVGSLWGKTSDNGEPSVAVAPECRRQGIAVLLFIRYLQAYGERLTVIELELAAKAELEGLLRRCGFEHMNHGSWTGKPDDVLRRISALYPND